MSDGEEAEVGVLPSTRRREEPSEEESYFCSRCGQLITTARERLEVDGGHLHTFVNPAGYVYRIACFRRAPGCRVAGEPTGEFTWFARHTWSFAECSGCRAHLGWSYFLADRLSFYGLLVERLISRSVP